MLTKKDNYANYIIIALSILAANFVIWVFSGQSLLDSNGYNTYSLQSQAWISGHLELPRDYPHLELAIYQGKYFVSFPPFPSIIMLPFVFLFGVDTPDGLICIFFAILGGIYAYKTSLNFDISKENSILLSLFVTIGSNFLFLTVNGWVWFIAQVMCFAFTMMSFYYATVKDRLCAAQSLFFIACAMGCRPFQAIYIFIIFYLIYKQYRGLKEDKDFIVYFFKSAVFAILLGIFYMWLNKMRFGSIFEFGHNYLPEFTRSAEGQFSLEYLKQNLIAIFKFPDFVDKRFVINGYGEMAFWLVSPIFVLYLIVYLLAGFNRIRGAIKNNSSRFNDIIIFLIVPLSIAIHIILFCMHKTLGGWQFGCRYTIDVLPTLLVGLLFILKELSTKLSIKDSLEHNLFKISISTLFIFGFSFNVVGTILQYVLKK